MTMISQIIKGNSFEILPTMPDKCVDMILTDVPYSLDQKSKEFLHDQFLRLSRGWIIVFSPPENQWILPPTHYGFWIKPISTKNTSKGYSRFVEMLFFYRNGSTVWNTGRHWSQYTNVFFDLVDDTTNSPHRKPPSLIERLMLNHSNPHDIILDPFAGSGVVVEVARRTQRSFIAIDEKDLDHLWDSYSQYSSPE